MEGIHNSVEGRNEAYYTPSADRNCAFGAMDYACRHCFWAGGELSDEGLVAVCCPFRGFYSSRDTNIRDAPEVLEPERGGDDDERSNTRRSK